MTCHMIYSGGVRRNRTKVALTFLLCWSFVTYVGRAMESETDADVDPTASYSHAINTLLHGEQNGVKRETHLVYPLLVSEDGDALTHNLQLLHPSHRLSQEARQDVAHRRIRRSGGMVEDVQVRLDANGRQFQIVLTPNRNLIAQGLQVTYAGDGTRQSGTGTGDTEEENVLAEHMQGCFMTGQLQGEDTSVAAINVCDGLTGMFISGGEEYLLEPVTNEARNSSPENTDTPTEDHRQAHYLTRTVNGRTLAGLRSTQQNTTDLGRPSRFQGVMCADKNNRSQNGSSTDTGGQTVHRLAGDEEIRKEHKRSVSVPYFVETHIVGDEALKRKHEGLPKTLAFMIGAMNMVSALFKDPSLGNSVEIVISRVTIGQIGLTRPYQVTPLNTTKTLETFCKWQSAVNGSSVRQVNTGRVASHDAAILFSGENLCEEEEDGRKYCDVLGVAKIGGMCTSKQSCSVAEDTGLFIAFTIAHELGHNFNMLHDSDGNICGSSTDKKYAPGLMAYKASNASKPYLWSLCSRESITEFLDDGRGSCLLNRPSRGTRHQQEQFNSTPVPSAAEQCQLSHGKTSRPCQESRMCSYLWCSTGDAMNCSMRVLPAMSGTPCPLFENAQEQDGVCHRGACIRADLRHSVSGGWSAWAEWESCSLTCGQGIRKRSRECSSPEPAHGGSYCMGERRQYDYCVEKDVQHLCSYVDGEALWRHQCEQWNTYRFDDHLEGAGDINWTVANSIETNRRPTCSLDCFSGRKTHTLATRVIDGTPCTVDSSDICISGRCMPVGCDKKIHCSTCGHEVKHNDICGQCGGDSSTCAKTTWKWKSKKRTGVVHVVTIPVGATSVKVVEDKPNGNTFIGLTSNVSNPSSGVNEVHHLLPARRRLSAGYHRVTSPADAYIYRRLTHGGQEIEEVLEAKGPITMETSVSYYLPPNSKRLSLSVSYYMPVESMEPRWGLGNWGPCSATCGSGSQQRRVHCFIGSEKVKTRHCRKNSTSSRPSQSARIRKCQAPACRKHYQWFESPNWSACSYPCDDQRQGTQYREVFCLKRDGSALLTEQESKCDQSLRPPTSRPCSFSGNSPNLACDKFYMDCPHGCRETCEDPTSAADHCRCVLVTEEHLNVNFSTRASCEQQRQSFLETCQSHQWTKGEWSGCNNGVNRRSVTCRSRMTETTVHDRFCSYCSKPISERICNQSQTPCAHKDNLMICRILLQNKGIREHNIQGFCENDGLLTTSCCFLCSKFQKYGVVPPEYL